MDVALEIETEDHDREGNAKHEAGDQGRDTVPDPSPGRGEMDLGLSGDRRRPERTWNHLATPLRLPLTTFLLVGFAVEL